MHSLNTDWLRKGAKPKDQQHCIRNHSLLLSNVQRCVSCQRVSYLPWTVCLQPSVEILEIKSTWSLLLYDSVRKEMSSHKTLYSCLLLFKGNAPWSQYETIKYHKTCCKTKIKKPLYNRKRRMAYAWDQSLLLSFTVAALVYIRASGRLPDAKGLTVYQWKRVVNMGIQPLSWPWCRAIHHLGLGKTWGWEVYPDGGHFNPGQRLNVLASIKPLSWFHIKDPVCRIWRWLYCPQEVVQENTLWQTPLYFPLIWFIG